VWHPNIKYKFSLTRGKREDKTRDAKFLTSELCIRTCNLFVWLVLISSERKILLAGCWWLICSERKVYCWLVADKPSEQADEFI
jgi:hypothetical protein